ncbi:MAG TPA: serine/threonine-protein phosphatase, partial [Anaerolineae bacterium]|nr:serine/threonine-protein phosphatase [Anaerolineae bacterium]
MATFETELTPLVVGQATDEGSRPNQEDRLLIREFTTRDGLPALLLMVADGIGGQSTGELASSIAQETIPQVLEELQPTTSELTKALVSALEEANKRIYEESLKDMSRAGMGTTCTAVAIVGKRLYLAHVGDSRAYLLRNGSLRQLTIDHTWAEEALRHGRSPEEIRNHPNRGVLKRFLGIEPYVEVDTRYKVSSALDDFEDAREKPLFLETTDTIMLCTDGVSDVLHEQQIEMILSRHPAPKAADELIKAALKAGASDNVTAVVADMPEAQKTAAAAAMPGWVWGALGALLLLLVLAVGGFFLMRGRSTPAAPTAVAAQPTVAEAAATSTPESSQAISIVDNTSSAAGGGLVVVDTPTPEPTEAPATATNSEEPTPTLVPTPTPTPTRVRTITRTTPRPSQPQDRNTGLPADFVLTLLEPQPGVTGDGFTLRWQTNYPLPPGFAFEPVVWKAGDVGSI